MRTFSLALVLLALAIAGCGDDDDVRGDNGGETATVPQGEAKGEFTFSQWPLYIDKKTIPEFERDTGIKVKYVEEINDNVEFFAKIRPLLRGRDRRPRDGGVRLARQAHVRAGLHLQARQRPLPNVENLSPEVKPPQLRPDGTSPFPGREG